MAMVCGLDLHRRQITFDALEVDSGEEWRGRVWQPDRGRFRRWLRGDLSRRAGVARWRWRAAPVGATWSRRSRPPASRRIWPNRQVGEALHTPTRKDFGTLANPVPSEAS